MKVEKTQLDGLVVIHPDVHDDKRGYFFESYNKPLFKSLGLPSDFVQDNQALSGKNTLRGLHYQLKYPQGKLIQVPLGKVYDISLDIRHGSPTFGQYFGIVLSDKNFNIVYDMLCQLSLIIPVGALEDLQNKIIKYFIVRKIIKSFNFRTISDYQNDYCIFLTKFHNYSEYISPIHMRQPLDYRKIFLLFYIIL